MTNQTKTRLLNRLADALAEVTNCRRRDIRVFDRDGRGFPQLCWDGPFEWTMITAGASVYSGTTGRYSTPTEQPIQDALDAIFDAGGYCEPQDTVTLNLWESRS